MQPIKAFTFTGEGYYGEALAEATDKLNAFLATNEYLDMNGHIAYEFVLTANRINEGWYITYVVIGRAAPEAAYTGATERLDRGE